MSVPVRHALPKAGAPPGHESTARVAAVFDVDGTLTASDIVRDLVAFRRAVDSGPRHARFMAALPPWGLMLLLLDQASRTAMNVVAYRGYAGFAASDYRTWAERFQAGPGRRRLHARGVDLVIRHAALGHRIVLVTGAVDLLVAPLARHLEERIQESLGHRHDVRVEAVTLAEDGGVFTGRLTRGPIGGVEKARRAAAVAQEEGIDLKQSFAYGDSIADLPLLECVGRPAAVNPDARLRLVARRRGWPVLELARTRTP